MEQGERLIFLQIIYPTSEIQLLPTAFMVFQEMELLHNTATGKQVLCESRVVSNVKNMPHLYADHDLNWTPCNFAIHSKTEVSFTIRTFIFKGCIL